jgi:hypothetical protein
MALFLMSAGVADQMILGANVISRVNSEAVFHTSIYLVYVTFILAAGFVRKAWFHWLALAIAVTFPIQFLFGSIGPFR